MHEMNYGYKKPGALVVDLWFGDSKSSLGSLSTFIYDRHIVNILLTLNGGKINCMHITLIVELPIEFNPFADFFRVKTI